MVELWIDKCLFGHFDMAYLASWHNYWCQCLQWETNEQRVYLNDNNNFVINFFFNYVRTSIRCGPWLKYNKNLLFEFMALWSCCHLVVDIVIKFLKHFLSRKKINTIWSIYFNIFSILCFLLFQTDISKRRANNNKVKWPCGWS